MAEIDEFRDGPQIVERIRRYAEELMERSRNRMATLVEVKPENDSEEERALRAAAQCDFTASCELSNDADKIEAAERRRVKPSGL